MSYPTEEELRKQVRDGIAAVAEDEYRKGVERLRKALEENGDTDE